MARKSPDSRSFALAEARKAGQPVVYGLSRPGGDIVYVGMTRNPKNRFGQYASPQHCHNPALAKWLQQGECTVNILHEGEIGLLDAEKREIRKRRGALFNLIGGGNQRWRNHESKPWMGRTGLSCPSTILLRYISMAKAANREKIKSDIRAIRDQMDDRCRAQYEAALAMEFADHPTIGPQILKWHDLTFEKMIPLISRQNETYGQAV
jgi:hypothetical protein